MDGLVRRCWPPFAAAPQGFNDLAGYIFGDNQRNAKVSEMGRAADQGRLAALPSSRPPGLPTTLQPPPPVQMEMTTPVFNEVSPGESAKMQFVMEGAYADPEALPTPKSGKVRPRGSSGQTDSP